MALFHEWSSDERRSGTEETTVHKSWTSPISAASPPPLREACELIHGHWMSGAYGLASQWSIALLNRTDLGLTTADRVAICHNLAGVLRDAGETALASGYQQLAQRFQQENHAANEFQVDAALISGRAQDALYAGDLETAERLFAIALQVEQARDNLEGAAADWGNLAAVSLLHNNTAVTVFRLREAWRLHLQLGDQLGCGQDLLNFAELLLRLRRPMSARRFAFRAKAHLKTAGANYLYPRLNELLAECIVPLTSVPLDQLRN